MRRHDDNFRHDGEFRGARHTDEKRHTSNNSLEKNKGKHKSGTWDNKKYAEKAILWEKPLNKLYHFACKETMDGEGRHHPLAAIVSDFTLAGPMALFASLSSLSVSFPVCELCPLRLYVHLSSAIYLLLLVSLLLLPLSAC